MRMPSSTYDLLRELTHDNPPPEEKWFAESYFDPPFRRTDLTAAARSGRVELDKANAEDWRFRFTSKGRADLAKELEAVQSACAWHAACLHDVPLMDLDATADVSK